MSPRPSVWSGRVEALAACDPNTVNSPKDPGLLQWLRFQRFKHNRGNLAPEHAKELESLGVVWNVSAARWEKNFALLEGYAAEHGTAVVSLSHVQDGVRLGAWLGDQRAKLGTGTLEPDRKQRLIALGVRAPERSDALWNEALSLLASYKAKHGNVRVPHRHAESGMGLGIWLANQRALRRTGKLSAERIAKLDALGNWGPGATWEAAFDLLLDYKTEHGHVNVPGKRRREGVALGTWVRTQRRENLLGRMSPERHAKLEAAGFRWRLAGPTPETTESPQLH